MQKNQSFTEGKILAPLIRFALPVLAGQKIGEKPEEAGKTIGSGGIEVEMLKAFFTEGFHD